MLLFNGREYERTADKSKFQYIPCYCSTLGHKEITVSENCFNTSHVTVQPVIVIITVKFIMCFNTSHVTVQQGIPKVIPSASAFQYIPCYCSTESLRELLAIGSVFQYIPCYCSTRRAGAIFNTILQFQYIPCYCSTKMKTILIDFHLSFNTSHVTVQPHAFKPFLHPIIPQTTDFARLFNIFPSRMTFT